MNNILLLSLLIWLAIGFGAYMAHEKPEPITFKDRLIIWRDTILCILAGPISLFVILPIFESPEIPEEHFYTLEEQEAVRRYKAGEVHGVSTFIDEDTIIAGYGGLEHFDFKYPLPVSYIKRIYGTTSWTEYFKQKQQ